MNIPLNPNYSNYIPAWCDGRTHQNRIRSSRLASTLTECEMKYKVSYSLIVQQSDNFVIFEANHLIAYLHRFKNSELIAEDCCDYLCHAYHGVS